MTTFIGVLASGKSKVNSVSIPITFIVAVLFSVVLSGCAGKSTHAASGTGTEEIGKKKIAVLPFANMSGIAEAGHVVSNAYVTEIFNAGKYSVEEPGNVRQFLIQEHVRNIGELGVDSIVLLGKRLKVDAVLVGTVEEYTYGAGYQAPVITVFARMVDTASGKVVWADKLSRNGEEYIWVFDFGLVRQPTILADRVASEMIDKIRW